MIAFNPFARHVLWHHAWRQHIRKAKAATDSEVRDYYCHMAVISNAEYVLAVAFELAKEKRHAK